MRAMHLGRVWTAAAVLSIVLTLPFHLSQAATPMTEVLPYVKTAVAVDQAAGVLYYTHAADRRIDTVLLSTGERTSYLLPPSVMSHPPGLAVDVSSTGPSMLLIADAEHNRIVRMNASNGVLLATYTTSDPSLQWPCGVAVSPTTGTLYVADTWNHRVVVLSAWGEQLASYTGSNVSSNGSGTVTSLRFPVSVSVDASGQRLHVADSGNKRVVVLSADNGTQLAAYTTSDVELSAPSDVVADAYGNVLVADTNNSRVVKLSATGELLAVYQSASAPFNHPSGVALDRFGALYVADPGNNRVVQLAWTAVYDVFTPQDPMLTHSYDLALDADGSMYISGQATIQSSAYV